jgi:hypothetical protein
VGWLFGFGGFAVLFGFCFAASNGGRDKKGANYGLGCGWLLSFLLALQPPDHLDLIGNEGECEV